MCCELFQHKTWKRMNEIHTSFMDPTNPTQHPSSGQCEEHHYAPVNTAHHPPTTPNAIPPHTYALPPHHPLQGYPRPLYPLTPLMPHYSPMSPDGQHFGWPVYPPYSTQPFTPQLTPILTTAPPVVARHQSLLDLVESALSHRRADEWKKYLNVEHRPSGK